MPSFARYLRAWWLATLCILIGVALFNLTVDPYGIFRVVSLKGFNLVKSQAGQRAGVFKRSALERMHPNTLILGNSRAEIGFNPDSRAWPSAARPVINLALPGTGVDSALHEFENALSSGHPTLALVALDFLDFRAEETVPAAPASSRPDLPHWWRERFSALFTMSALLDSIATVNAQYQPFPTSLTDAGFNPMHDYASIARNEGYYAMFRQREEENAKAYVRGPKSIYHADGRPSDEFRAVEQIIVLAGQKRIAVRFVIYPYHAHLLVLIHRSELWAAFEDWKRELVRRVEAASPGVDIELWDFSGFAPYADEPVPRQGDTESDMRWYWEAGHFKSSLGDLLLDRLFDHQELPMRWGSRLDGKNLETHLEHQRRSRDEYEASHAEESAELVGLVARARRNK